MTTARGFRTGQITSIGLAFLLLGSCGGESSNTTDPLTADPTTTTAQATPSTPDASKPFDMTDWIAYQTNRGGSEGVWLIHPDGSDDHEIGTDLSGENLLPDWSPDGSRVVLATRGGSTEPLFEFDLASEVSTQLFDCEDPCLGDDEPVYSPDGSRVAFIRYLAPFVNDVPSDCGIWIGEIATGEVVQVTSNQACYREYQPHWSPDGSALVYWRWREEPGAGTTGTAVFTVGVDGTDEQQLTDWEIFAGSPDWSPDGEWISFSTYPLQAFQCCEMSNLYRMRPAGSEVEQLTSNETADLRATQPRYTPDGEWILYTSVTPSARTLAVIPANGGGAVELTDSGIYTHGTWQP